jgi:hypothetical protein
VEEADHEGSGMYCLPLRMIGRSDVVEEGDGVVGSEEDEVDVATCADEDGALEDGCGRGFLAR